MATGNVNPKKGKVVDIPSTTVSIGTATDGGNGVSASVAFTPTTYSVGGPQVKYTATSNPGSFTADATASPITVSGLTAGTAYTFTVAAGNATGYNAPSAASNSVTISNPPAYDSIATTTVSTPVSTITFSSIPSGYTHLQLRIIARGTVAQTEMQTFYRFNGDTGSNYAIHFLRSSGAAVFNGDGTSIPQASAQTRYPASLAASSIFGAGVTDILDYKNTSKYTTMRSLGGVDANGSGQLYFTSGLWMNTSAVTSITIGINDGGDFAQYSSFALYGIKGA
jgi:hypothetical protein